MVGRTRHTWSMTSSLATRPPRRTLRERMTTPTGALLTVATMLALLWLLELIDQLTGNALDTWGIATRDPADLGSLATAPLVHYGWDHLIGNSLPFLVLGTIVLIGGVLRWVITTVTTTITSGGAAWLFSATGTITGGASGVIFGWLTYVLVRGIFTRNVWQIVIGLVVLFFYGGMLAGVLPVSSGVSWQGHLGGAAGGVLAAWLLHGRDRRTPVAQTSSTRSLDL